MPIIQVMGSAVRGAKPESKMSNTTSQMTRVIVTCRQDLSDVTVTTTTDSRLLLVITGDADRRGRRVYIGFDRDASAALEYAMSLYADDAARLVRA